jgi:hypothetical protein
MLAKRTLFLVLSAAALLILPACPPKVVPDRERPKPVYLAARPKELLSGLQARNGQVKGLQARGSLKYRFTYATRDYEGTDINFQFEKPNKVYVRGTRRIIGTIFSLHCDGSQFWAVNPRGKEVYTGPVNRAFRWGGETEIWQGLHPAVLAEALLFDEIESDQFVCETFPNSYIIALYGRAPDGTLTPRRRIWFERENLRVSRHQVFAETGEMTTEAQFYRYTEVGGLEIPQTVYIDRPWEELRLVLELSEIRINPEINEELFRFEVPEGFQVKRLEESKEEDAQPR